MLSCPTIFTCVVVSRLLDRMTYRLKMVLTWSTEEGYTLHVEGYTLHVAFWVLVKSKWDISAMNSVESVLVNWVKGRTDKSSLGK